MKNDLLEALVIANYGMSSIKEKVLEDYEYLLHHVVVDDNGDETLHHCFIYDHIANMFEQGHLVVRDGKAYLEGKLVREGSFHVIVGLEPTQKVVWSDEDARENGITPKNMVAGMTLKQKGKEW